MSGRYDNVCTLEKLRIYFPNSPWWNTTADTRDLETTKKVLRDACLVNKNDDRRLRQLCPDQCSTILDQLLFCLRAIYYKICATINKVKSLSLSQSAKSGFTAAAVVSLSRSSHISHSVGGRAMMSAAEPHADDVGRKARPSEKWCMRTQSLRLLGEKRLRFIQTNGARVAEDSKPVVRSIG
ncbi:uncharacterized protein [Narcine bancroftii]|uniref:uncharacterized protein isoform X2 n=1 Tax=Narcine bancroftii TaxID=1343680 RepID=UPI003831CBE0